MILHCSHLLLASNDVPRMMTFLERCFGLVAKFANSEFGECVTPSGFRIAVFAVIGKVKENFSAEGVRGAVGIGVTVRDVDGFWREAEPKFAGMGARGAGAPKEHPWGEKSCLVIDPDGNRWEVAESPTESGVLVDRD